jgi:putative heme transporter
VVEAVLIAALVTAGGDREQVTAAVLVYRALTWALPILLGMGAGCGGIRASCGPSRAPPTARRQPSPRPT